MRERSGPIVLESAPAVFPMRGCEHQRTANGEYPVRGQSQLRVSDGRPNDKQQHAERATCDNALVTMAAKTDCEREHTERNNQNQNLIMKVRVCELSKKWHAGHDQRQREAMHQAQC